MTPYNEPVALAINTRIIGKPPVEQRGWYADQWQRVLMRPSQVARLATTQGYAWTCLVTPQVQFETGYQAKQQIDNGLWGGRRKQDAFESLTLFGVDFDTCGIESVLDAYPLATEHASFVYESHSSTPQNPRCRLVFCTDEPLAYSTSRQLIRALYWHFHDAEPDGQTTDPTRLWYGAPGKQALARYGVLDADTRHNLTDEYEKAHQPAKVQPRSQRKPTSRYGQAALEKELARVQHASEGSRNALLFGAACNLYELVNTGALDNAAITELLAAATGRGLTEVEAQTTITSARQKTAGKMRTMPMRAPIEVRI